MEVKKSCIFGTVPRYDFCNENKKYLQRFLDQSAENMSNKFCDLKHYESFKKVLPLGQNLSKKNEIICVFVDITSSDDEIEGERQSLNRESEKDEIEITNLNQTTVNDIAYSIKETLDTEKNVPISILSTLQMSNNTGDIFSVLSDKLNHEDVVNLGLSIKEVSLTNDLVVTYYIRSLLIKEMHLEYSDEIQDIINDFAINYENSLTEEICQCLLNEEKPPNRVILQFLEGTNTVFKNKLFKCLTSKCSALKESHIGTIDVLLNNPVDNDSLNKLVDMMSNSAITLSSDKNFGKLVINVLKVLGRNVVLLEQSLKHVINSHRSIWKSKMLQILQSALQETFSMTQSFRD